MDKEVRGHSAGQEPAFTTESQLQFFPTAFERWAFREPTHWCVIILVPYALLLILGTIIAFQTSSRPPWWTSWELHVIVAGLFCTVIAFEHWRVQLLNNFRCLFESRRLWFGRPVDSRAGQTEFDAFLKRIAK